MSSFRTNTGKIFAAWLFGTLAGALLGVFFGPSSGKKKRSTMDSATSDKEENATESVEEPLKATKSRARKNIEGLKEKANAAASSVKKKFQEYKNSIRPNSLSHTGANSHGHGHRG